jgi:dTDP-4-dehydrorhamnose 3,5-epimerase-like enzyme
VSIGRLETCKRVVTKNFKQQPNGSLTEVYKDGDKTLVYMTSVKPGCSKGYHLHKVRAARYFPVLGTVKIVLWIPGQPESEKEEFILDSANPQSLYIPKAVATLLLNEGNSEAFFINFPNPAYDPKLKDEQVEYTENELLSGVVK